MTCIQKHGFKIYLSSPSLIPSFRRGPREPVSGALEADPEREGLCGGREWKVCSEGTQQEGRYLFEI